MNACAKAESVGDDSVWLTQAAIADLFQTTPQNITLHIGAIYQEEELSEESTCKEYLQVRQEGSRRGRPKHCRGSARRKSHSLLPLQTSLKRRRRTSLLHIGAIYQEGELSEDSTCKEYLQVRQEGSRRTCKRSEEHTSELQSPCNLVCRLLLE